MRGSPPFDSDLALGALDSAFLFAYSLGMFATGVLADRARDLAVFLGGAHVLAGLALVALGAGTARRRPRRRSPSSSRAARARGRASSTGVARVRRGDGAPLRPRAPRARLRRVERRAGARRQASGLVLARVLALAARRRPTAFAAPGVACVAVGALICAALRAAGDDAAADDDGARASVNGRFRGVRRRRRGPPQGARRGAAAAVGARAILAVPGLVPFSLCLFLNKLVAYALMLWLPLFLTVARPRRSERGHDLRVLRRRRPARRAGVRVAPPTAGARARPSRRRASRSARRRSSRTRARPRRARAARPRCSSPSARSSARAVLAQSRRPSPRTSGNTPSLDARALSTVTGIVDGVGSCGTAAQGVVVGYLVHAYHGWWATFRLLALALGRRGAYRASRRRGAAHVAPARRPVAEAAVRPSGVLQAIARP